MKKVKLLIIMLLLCLGISACDDNNEIENNNPSINGTDNSNKEENNNTDNANNENTGNNDSTNKEESNNSNDKETTTIPAILYDEITKEVWDEIKNNTYEDFTIERKSEGEKDVVLEILELSNLQKEVGLTNEQKLLLNEAKNNKQMKKEYILITKYNKDYYYESMTSDYTNTTYSSKQEYQYFCKMADATFYTTSVTYQAYTKPYTYNVFNQETMSIETIVEDRWGKCDLNTDLPSKEISGHLEFDFEEYTFDSTNRCYTYVKETKISPSVITGVTNEITYEKISYRLYFKDSKLVKFEIIEQITEEYFDLLRSGYRNAESLKKTNSPFMTYQHDVYEFKNYGSTIIDKPADLLE